MKKYGSQLDFVICSMHAIDKNDMYYPDYFIGKTQYESYETYYKRLLDIVKNFDDYCVLGHLDLVKRYGGYKDFLEDKLFIAPSISPILFLKLSKFKESNFICKLFKTLVLINPLSFATFNLS